MVDYIPLLSQAKSAIQAICGNKKGARETQHKFTKSFPVISQVRGVVELAMGREEEAKDTFKTGGTFLDGIPVVGHVKGIVHYACRDKEGGDAAMISSSRTTGVIGGAVGGFFVGGPVGGAAGAVAGGAVMDTVTTAVDSAIHGEARTHGTLNAIKQIHDDPKDPWRYADLVVVPAIDAVAGYTAARCIAKPGVNPVKAAANVVKTPEHVGLAAGGACGIQSPVAGFEHQLHVCKKCKHIVKPIISGEASGPLYHLNKATPECPYENSASGRSNNKFKILINVQINTQINYYNN